MSLPSPGHARTLAAGIARIWADRKRAPREAGLSRDIDADLGDQRRDRATGEW
jgi:hypothetical protein